MQSYSPRHVNQDSFDDDDTNQQLNNSSADLKFRRMSKKNFE